MNRPPLWRTTTARLTATFVLIFVVFSVLLLGFIAYQSSILLQRQQSADIDREVALLQRTEQQRGLRSLVMAVERLSRQPGPGIYYLGDASGLMLIGNADAIPTEVIQTPGVYTFTYDKPRPFEGDTTQVDAPEGYGLVRSVILQSGLRLVVGRDVVERQGFTAIILQWFFVGAIGILVLSTVAGLVTAQRVLRRIETVTETSTKIMSGNLSERVPITTRNDEFDGLATSLNAMLDRIEQLMQGLKEVTDNVAHDLKTPLTRLRNQAESALRDPREENKAQALEAVISESDKLIRTFNALLMIARAEAGAPSGAFADVDISAVVADVAELYGPVAEEEGMVLETAVTEGIHLRANRELLGQAMVNLIENAIKYYDGAPGEGRITVGVRRQDDLIRIEVGDNGPGIPPEDRTRVLDRFVRLEKSRTEAGSGLGLSLVAAVARLHKGDFRIEDNEPGALAVMELPVS